MHAPFPLNDEYKILLIHIQESEKLKMKSIKKVDIGTFALYGAVLTAFWTFCFGFVYYLLGWMFGATSWWIDMNLGNWTVFTMYTFLMIFWRALIAGAVGALAGTVVAFVYNFVAGVMGGIKINLE